MSRPDATPGPIGVERLLVVAATALFLHLVLFRHGTLIYPFSKGSNGVFFDEAARVVDGEVMYRDFFEFLAPGIVYFDAALVAVFGHRVDVFGWTAVALGSALTVLVHSLASHLIGAGWRLVPPAAFAVLLYAPHRLGDHKWPALLFGLLGIAAILRLRGNFGASLAGSCFGLGALFTQDFGLGLAAGAAVHLLTNDLAPRGRVWALALGVLAPVALAMGVLAWAAGASVVLYDSVLFPLTAYARSNTFHVDLDLSWRAAPRTAAHFTIVVGGILAGLTALRNRAEAAARLAAWGGLGLFVAGGFRSLYPIGLALQSVLWLPLLVRTMERARVLHPVPRLLARAATAVLGLGILHGSVGFVLWRQWGQPLTLETHRAGRIWAVEPMPELSWIESNTVPGERVFLLPAKGGFYFLSATRNATSLPYVIADQTTPEQLEQSLREIEAARPRVGLWDERAQWPHSSITGRLAPLYLGIARSYEQERLANGVIAFRRSPAAAGAQGPR